MNNKQNTTEVILIGAGIMSATLGTLLKKLQPDWHITLFEKLDRAGKESSNEWNNAGTGHAALCELNYTTEKQDGSIDISKAVKINEQFHVSRQFWSHLVDGKEIRDPQEFIRPLPHMSFVHGEDNVEFLKKRFEVLSGHPLFKGMEFSEDPEKIKEWIPLMMEGRTSEEPIAATSIGSGTDINFGELTRKLLDNLANQDNVDIRYNHTVNDIQRMEDGSWEVNVRNYEDDTLEYHTANFVFIGAGGGALPLLQKTDIPESKQIGGFPISGQFLVCSNPEVVEQHRAKVYGKEPKGTPPMTVPHLDRRYIQGKNSLLFGPYAGFSPKFLKTGSSMDLFRSVKPNNIFTLMAAGAKNIPLTKYLVQQLMESKEQRMEALRDFVPHAKSEDWDLVVAGQRVQVIADTEAGGKGTIQFGTELIHSEDGSMAALLGASPGASVSVSAMLDVFKSCFPHYLKEWEPKIKEMIPSYGESLAENPELLREVFASSSHTLGLENEKRVD
ncbi:malate dehydrogenase (quinone) [Lentibacillus sediminis]|uniref:malate dehydrogenase (quinone) n=1 Tax=Lentibacillus sediminis TaxID=1940529 RepID=UPI000C1BB5CF|nr:malate dehydrogenase (quinone) [Lentibacillus sediminis]